MKVKVNAFLHWRPEFNIGGAFQVWGHDMSNMSDFSPVLGKQELEFEVMDFDPRAATLAMLRAQKNEIIAEATQKATAIEEQIQQLLALDAPTA